MADVTVTLLFFTPMVVPVTFTENVQFPLAGNVAPERLTDPAPTVAVIAPPPQEPVSPFGVATTMPAGKLSVNVTPVSEAVFPAGLVIVKVSEVVLPTGIDAPPNALMIMGAAMTTWGFPVKEPVLPLKFPSPP